MTERLCPYCGEDCDAETQADERDTAVPEPGDFAICFYCAEPAAYDENLQFRKTTEFERLQLEVLMPGLQQMMKDRVNGKV